MAEYDLAQRERIRETLLAYMKEHKIGVPRLAARIKETVHRNPEIPVKTLQRFMKGEVRTIDMHVGFLAQFVEKVSKVDATPRLGFALSAFYSSKDKTDWSGTFVAAGVRTFERGTGGGIPVQGRDRSRSGDVARKGSQQRLESQRYLRWRADFSRDNTRHRHEGSSFGAAADDDGFPEALMAATKASPLPPIFLASTRGKIAPLTVQTRSARIALK